MPAYSAPYAFRELWVPSRHKAYHGGRGGAKSHSFADALVSKGYERRDLRWLCAREIQKSLNVSVKQLIEDKIKAQGLGPVEDGGNGYYRITERSITGGDGRTEFLFAGLRTNPDSIKSMEGLDGAWVEEANMVSQRSIDLLIPTVRKPNSELWWSWNRTKTSDPVDKMFLGGEAPPRSIVRKVGWQDNPWFPEDLREQMLWDKRRDRDKWLHIWEGEPVVRSEAQVFQNWRVEDIDDQIPEGCVPLLGADWGYANDPTVLIVAYVFGRTLYIRKELWKLKLDIDYTPAFWAGDDWLDPTNPRWENPYGYKGLEEARYNKIRCDSARPELIAYLQKRGFKTVAAKKGPGSVVEGVEFMKSYDIVVHPSCTHVEDEMTFYSYKVDDKTDEVLSELADKKNHTIDSCRYALENLRRALGGRVGMQGGEVIPVSG